MAHPKAYLKRLGVQIDTKPAQLDNRFKASLPPELQEELEEAWSMRSMGMEALSTLYGIPRTTKQAALLFSHDARRYEKSLAWFDRVATELDVESILEVGCGAGFTGGFLKSQSPGRVVSGVEAKENLANIASELVGAEVVVGDYLQLDPASRSDLVICDFGFDLTNLRPSTKPHRTAQFEEFQYCPGCSEDLTPQFEEYIRAWRSWMCPGGYLAVAGRLTNFGAVLAFGQAAKRLGMSVIDGLSTVLTTQEPGLGRQRFPALVFVDDGEARFSAEDAAKIYRR
jgi:hypothetical protein